MRTHALARGRAGTPRPTRPVLVVEHTPDVADLWAAVLGEAGYVVQCLLGPVEIEAELRRRRPCLLVVDLRPPRAEARRLLDELRKLPADVRVPVLATTTYAPLLQMDLAAYGIGATIGKPFDVDDLLMAVRRAMGSRWTVERGLSAEGMRDRCQRAIARGPGVAAGR